MKSQKILKSVKRFCSKCSSLILLFQRSPLIQMLLPEANVLGTSGVMNTVSLTIATVAGLGAYDTVAGATLVSQVSPSSGSATIPASSGVQLNGVFQITLNNSNALLGSTIRVAAASTTALYII